MTATGLLFVTLSDETVSFEEFFPGLEELIDHVDFTRVSPRRLLRYEGNYNWKTMIDGFQECLHCSYAHPEFSKVYAPQTFKVVNRTNYSRHLAESDKPDDGPFLYFFPNSTLNFYGGGMSSFRACPTEDPTKTMMEFDYYHEQPLESEEFEKYYKLARTVAVEDHELCEKAQTNLNVGIYTEGILNPNRENGVACECEESQESLEAPLSMFLQSIKTEYGRTAQLSTRRRSRWPQQHRESGRRTRISHFFESRMCKGHGRRLNSLK